MNLAAAAYATVLFCLLGLSCGGAPEVQAEALPFMRTVFMGGIGIPSMNFATVATSCGAMAITEAPAASNLGKSSRNCARCRRQNGQGKPRRKATTTGPRARCSARSIDVPVPSGREKSGACEPIPAVSLCVATTRRYPPAQLPFALRTLGP